jgi:hypothetical protein
MSTNLFHIYTIKSKDINGNVIKRIIIKERLPALVRDLFTFSSKVIKSFIIV